MAERTTDRIVPERCTPGGQSGPDAMDWALRGGLVAVAAAALWLVVTLVAPLPTGQATQPPPIPALGEIPSHAAPIQVRQRRLAGLDSGGNLFASDRRNWAVAVAEPDGPGETTELVTSRFDESAPVTTPVGAEGIDSIELAEDVSVAIKKRLEQLKLRGVFAIGDRRTAMIGKKGNASSEAYREGDTLEEGEWKLVAIDTRRDRVILNRSGQNFELLLYDTGSSAAAQPRASISATNAPGEVEIGFTSLDKVASELRDAGMPRDQINELIALAQESPDDESDETAPEAEPDPDAEKPAIPPAMPPGMVQLFKAMAEGSRDVVAPTPVPAEAEGDDAGEPDAEESDDDEG